MDDKEKVTLEDVMKKLDEIKYTLIKLDEKMEEQFEETRSTVRLFSD